MDNNNFFKDNYRMASWILGVGIILVIFAPFIFTRHTGLISFYDTGTIGDTIGGITAPITSLIGSILVFFALKAQIEANRIIQQQIEEQKMDETVKMDRDYISKLYDYFVKSVDDFTYDTVVDLNINQKGIIIHKGYNGIQQYLIKSDLMVDRHEKVIMDLPIKVREIYGIFQIVVLLIDKINFSNVNQKDKQFFKELIQHQFDYYINPSFEGIIDKNFAPSICDECGEIHGDYNVLLFTIVDSINKELKRK